MRQFYPLEKRHIYILKEWRNAQIKILRQKELLTNYQQKKWFDSLKHDKSQVLFEIIENEEFIGYCGLTNIDWGNKRGEISFLTNPKRTQKEQKEDFLAALNMICEYGFKKLGLNKIFQETFGYRKDHIKIMEEFGFYLEGELRESYFKQEKFVNSFIQSILASEWK